MPETRGSQERANYTRCISYAMIRKKSAQPRDSRAGTETLDVSFQNQDTIYLMCHV